MDNVINEHKGAKNRKISGPFCTLWEMSRRLSFCVFLFIGGLYHSQLHTELIQFIAAGRTDPLISDHHVYIADGANNGQRIGVEFMAAGHQNGFSGIFYHDTGHRGTWLIVS